jgi:2-hydroxycyclohexanecarboxyl-CoA dehydrogenase
MSEPHDGPLAGRTAIVTGGASGIGLACARRLAADGAAVAVLDRNGEGAEAAAATLRDRGHRAIGCAVDVVDRAAVDAAVARTTDELGAPLVLVTSAGKDFFGRFLDLTPETWSEIVGINLTGTFHCCQAVIPGMVAAGWGRIITISSSSAQGGQEFMAPYASAKAGVVGLTKSLAREFGPRGITVNTIPPGFVDTPMLRAAEAKGLLGTSVEENEKRTPVRRVGRPDDIANAAAFLAADAAGYITGQIIGVNGGRVT